MTSGQILNKQDGQYLAIETKDGRKALLNLSVVAPEAGKVTQIEAVAAEGGHWLILRTDGEAATYELSQFMLRSPLAKKTLRQWIEEQSKVRTRKIPERD